MQRRRLFGLGCKLNRIRTPKFQNRFKVKVRPSTRARILRNTCKGFDTVVKSQANKSLGVVSCLALITHII